MPVRPSSPLTPSQPPKRSIFSRIRSPFRSNTRNYLDFDIQPDDPHRQYSPGDVLTGTVFVKVGRPMRITHLVVSLVGYAQVFKTPNSPGEGYRAHTGLRAEAKKKREGVAVANGFVMLFEDEMILCGEGRLDPRIYEFKFELIFPRKSLPSSIEVRDVLPC
jgi:arrestin-related trafficking adapter 9